MAWERQALGNKKCSPCVQGMESKAGGDGVEAAVRWLGSRGSVIPAFGVGSLLPAAMSRSSDRAGGLAGPQVDYAPLYKQGRDHFKIMGGFEEDAMSVQDPDR